MMSIIINDRAGRLPTGHGSSDYILDFNEEGFVGLHCGIAIDGHR